MRISLVEEPLPPMAEKARSTIHQLTNILQALLGYLELGQYAKARGQIKEALKLLDQLRKQLAAL